MTGESRVVGLFTDAEQVVGALKAFKDSPWSVRRVYSPIPHHKIAEALKLPRSRVGYFTLVGGIIGFFTGFLLAAYTSIQWDLIVGGKPIVALVPFFIVGFEFTILFSVFGNVLGLINVSRLPDTSPPADYDPRCSGDHYGIVAACPPDNRDALAAFLKERGADVSPATPPPAAG